MYNLFINCSIIVNLLQSRYRYIDRIMGQIEPKNVILNVFVTIIKYLYRS